MMIDMCGGKIIDVGREGRYRIDASVESRVSVWADG